jgi:hypothetical protein
VTAPLPAGGGPKPRFSVSAVTPNVQRVSGTASEETAELLSKQISKLSVGRQGNDVEDDIETRASDQLELNDYRYNVFDSDNNNMRIGAAATTDSATEDNFLR